MKNQYFRDINDYRKYGLLRILQSKGNGRLLIAWMLPPDDGSRDGGFRSYLHDPGTWMCYDPQLFTDLAGLLRPVSIPEVALIERSALLPGRPIGPARCGSRRRSGVRRFGQRNRGSFEARRSQGLLELRHLVGNSRALGDRLLDPELSVLAA
jgi:hypothetical protein